MVDRGEYGSSEAATITVSGPAALTVVSIDTEMYFDFLYIGTVPFTGGSDSNDLPASIEVPDFSTTTIGWSSDYSVHGGGWKVEYVHHLSDTTFIFQNTPMQTGTIQVVSAFRDWESQGGNMYADIEDYNDPSPIPPRYAPKSINFTDTCPTRN